MSVGVVFQCGSCRALGVAAEVVVGADGTSVGLACASCASTTWLPVAAAGSVRAQARSPGTAPRALPPASSSALPPLMASNVNDERGDNGGDDGGTSHDVLAPPASTSTSTLPTAAAARSNEPVPGIQAVATTATATATASKATAVAAGFAEDVRARIVERWKRLGEFTAEQAPLAARLERLAQTGWHDESEHKSLLKAASVAGELAFVGARYRAVLDVVRDDPRARAAQQELLNLAMLTMKGPRDFEGTGEPRGKSKAYVAALVVAMLGFLGAAGYFMFQIVESFRHLGELG
jgi:hypothetical protein